MKLYLVQHGEACTKEVDPERPLTESGKADVARLAAFLGRAGIRVERVVHSGKLRALQTADQLAAVIAPGVELEASARLDPNGDPKEIDWQSESGGRDTLIAGHLPFMAKLVAHLVTGDEDRPITAYRPGTVVCLERSDDAGWQIGWMIRPELLA